MADLESQTAGLRIPLPRAMYAIPEVPPSDQDLRDLWELIKGLRFVLSSVENGPGDANARNRKIVRLLCSYGLIVARATQETFDGVGYVQLIRKHNVSGEKALAWLVDHHARTALPGRGSRRSREAIFSDRLAAVRKNVQRYLKKNAGEVGDIGPVPGIWAVKRLRDQGKV